MTERKTLADVRAALMVQVAEASVTAKKLTEELTRFEGRAQNLVEEKLRTEAAKLADAEHRLHMAYLDAEGLADTEHHRDWFVGVLSNFSKNWRGMTPENQGRLMRLWQM